jgi:hypothetical protein
MTTLEALKSQLQQTASIIQQRFHTSRKTYRNVLKHLNAVSVNSDEKHALRAMKSTVEVFGFAGDNFMVVYNFLTKNTTILGACGSFGQAMQGAASMKTSHDAMLKIFTDEDPHLRVQFWKHAKSGLDGVILCKNAWNSMIVHLQLNLEEYGVKPYNSSQTFDG